MQRAEALPEESRRRIRLRGNGKRMTVHGNAGGGSGSV